MAPQLIRPHEVEEALERAARVVHKRMGLPLDDELLSEIGEAVAIAASRWSLLGAPFVPFAVRFAVQRVKAWMLQEAVRKKAVELLGWLDVEVRDDARLPIKKALREIVASLPVSLRGAAHACWVRGLSFGEAAAESGLPWHEFSARLDRAAVEVVKIVEGG